MKAGCRCRLCKVVGGEKGEGWITKDKGGLCRRLLGKKKWQSNGWNCVWPPALAYDCIYIRGKTTTDTEFYL